LLKPYLKAKLSLCIPLRHTGGEEVQLYSSLTSPPQEDVWTTSSAGCFSPGKRAPKYLLGGWVDTIAFWTLCRREKSVPLAGINNHSSLAVPHVA